MKMMANNEVCGVGVEIRAKFGYLQNTYENAINAISTVLVPIQYH